MTPKLLLALPVALLLAGCGVTESIKETVYRVGAERGNLYCATRDGELRDSAVASINRGLRGEGALFDFQGIKCDNDATDDTATQS